MYIQREFYRTSATMTRNDTYRVSLPKNGFVSSILLHMRGTPVNDARRDVDAWRFVDFVSKVEVLANQATVIQSLYGPMAHVRQWLDGGPLMTDQHHNYGTSTLRCRLPIQFGRKFNDTEYGLDLSRWDDVELRIANTATSTYFSADPTVDIMINYIRDVGGTPFRGYFRSEEWNKYTTVASEKKYLELPTEYRIRRILMQIAPLLDSNHAAPRTPYNTLSNIELFLKTGQLKVWDANLRDLWYDNLFADGRLLLVGAEQYSTDGKGFKSGLGQTFYKAGVRLPHGGTQNTYGTSLVPGLDSTTVEREVPTDAEQDSLLLAGIAPESCAWFDFATPDDPTGYLDPATQKTVQLNYTIGADANDAGAVIRTVLDRFVPY